MPSTILQVIDTSEFLDHLQRVGNVPGAQWQFGQDGIEPLKEVLKSLDAHWFYYTDQLEGIRLRLYDRMARERFPRAYVAEQGNDVFGWVTVSGQNLGPANGPVKRRLRSHLAFDIPSKVSNRQDLPADLVIRCDYFEFFNRISAYTPLSLEDARRRRLQLVILRQGQTRFRDALRRIFGEKCIVTGCTCMYAVDAAHIVPFLNEGTNDPTNGLLLRTDLHALFDYDLIDINANTFCVEVKPKVTDEYYRSLAGRPITLPARFNAEVLRDRLRQRRELLDSEADDDQDEE